MNELGVSGESSHHGVFMTTNLAANIENTSKLVLTAEELYKMCIRDRLGALQFLPLTTQVPL